jgi:hypothetical protein
MVNERETVNPVRQAPYFAAAQPDPLDVTAEDLAEAWRVFIEDFEIYEAATRLFISAPR